MVSGEGKIFPIIDHSFVPSAGKTLVLPLMECGHTSIILELLSLYIAATSRNFFLNSQTALLFLLGYMPRCIVISRVAPDRDL